MLVNGSAAEMLDAYKFDSTYSLAVPGSYQCLEQFKLNAKARHESQSAKIASS